MRILVVASDLMARARVRSAAEAAGAEVSFTRPDEGSPGAGFDVVVVDLDEAGPDRLDPYAGAAARVVGYYSHVDAALGERASSVGITPVRRGRFWSDLAAHLGL